MIPTEFLLTAAIFNSEKHGDYFDHFGINKDFLSLYGDKRENLRRVRLQVIPDVNLDNRIESNNVEYWGYWNNEHNRLSLIYPSYIQFAICFPYGPKSEEQVGRGKCLNLKIIEVLPYE